jgi:hypothetical protein
MKKLLTLFIAWIFLYLTSFSQTTVYIQARGGVTAGMSHIKDAGEYSKYFRTRFYYGQNTGLAIGLKFPNRLSIEAGYENNIIGIEVIENLRNLVYDTVHESIRHGVYKGTGFTYHCIPIRFSFDMDLSKRLIFQPTLGLQFGYNRDAYTNLGGWGDTGISLKLTKSEYKSGYTVGFQYGGELAWRATKKTRNHQQYFTFLVLHNIGLITNYVHTYSSYAQGYGTFQRVVNFRASYLGATIGYRYFLTKDNTTD